MASCRPGAGFDNAPGRQPAVAHYSYHVGQIVFLSKHQQAEKWQSLTVPRSGSATFNRDVAEGRKSQR